MKARDLIQKLMQHDLDLEVFARVKIFNVTTQEDDWIDVPFGDVNWKNDGSGHDCSPRIVIEAPASINASVEFKFELA